VSTKGIIDRVIPWCPGWSRSSGKKNLLKIGEQGLQELFAFDHDKMIWRGTDNDGFPPYLITAAGQFDYDVDSSTLSCGALTRTISGTTHTFVARKVNRIFVDVTQMSTVYSRTYFGKPYSVKLNPYTTQTTRLFVADELVDSDVGYENTAPRVSFKQDPGTFTDRYFIEVFIGPPPLLSENIQMPIPVRFEKAIEEYVIGTVQSRESGRMHDYLQRFEQKWIPEFQGELIGSASTEIDETPIRRC
jgi:hypothetical protein